MIRIILIIGAAACFVIGGKRVAEDIVYQVNLDSLDFLLFTAFPFLPIILMAPRYKNGGVIYGFIAVAEILIIVTNHFVVLR
jgi:hypothetical protein